jgi:Cysteine rich repeat
MRVELAGRVIAGAVLCMSLGLAGSVFAAPSCKADVAQFCPQVHPGGGRIAQCLKEHEAQLSEGCKERIKMVVARMKEVKEACEDDVQQFCAGVKMGGGRVAHCLKQHEDKLSAECKTQITDMLEKK